MAVGGCTEDPVFSGNEQSAACLTHAEDLREEDGKNGNTQALLPDLVPRTRVGSILFVLDLSFLLCE